MTTPKEAEYQGPRFALRGMVRDRLMPADSPNLCAAPENRDWFDEVIDARFANHKPESTRLSAAIREAKSICGRCTVRNECLVVHGPDFELGVVAGATDQERRNLFGEASA
jgi:hypothetical protein